MNYYPIMINLHKRLCLIIGGGKVAYRKISELLENEVEIKIISKDINDDIKRLIDEEKVSYIGSEYKSEFLEKVFLVIIATNDKELNKKILQDCLERNILVNSVDNPKESNFIQPSKINKGDITISISTNGKSPILSKIIKNKVSEIIDNSYSDYIDILGEYRTKALLYIDNEALRREFFIKITNEAYLNEIRKDGKEVVYKKIEEIFNEYRVTY
ncbi:MAG: bifunctional precorrin-2 dehydrogenase/sirohydrochlorin ferrochelatase [Clostridiaceae bacterium]